jgi:hypothetical protein
LAAKRYKDPSIVGLDLGLNYLDSVLSYHDFKFELGINDYSSFLNGFINKVQYIDEIKIVDFLNKHGDADILIRQSDIATLHYPGMDHRKRVKILKKYTFTQDELLQLYFTVVYQKELLDSFKEAIDIKSAFKDVEKPKILDILLSRGMKDKRLIDAVVSDGLVDFSNEEIKSYLVYEALKNKNVSPNLTTILQLLKGDIPVYSNGDNPIGLLLNSASSSPSPQSYKVLVNNLNILLHYYGDSGSSMGDRYFAQAVYFELKNHKGKDEILNLFMPTSQYNDVSVYKGLSVLDIYHKEIKRQALMTLISYGAKNAKLETVSYLLKKYSRLADYEMVKLISSSFENNFIESKVGLCDYLGFSSSKNNTYKDFIELYGCTIKSEKKIESLTRN